MVHLLAELSEGRRRVLFNLMYDEEGLPLRRRILVCGLPFWVQSLWVNVFRAQHTLPGLEQ